ncbi:MAG TPA: hypothetical protein VF882_05940, partial [Gemmatimonadales bacterium]
MASTLSVAALGLACTDSSEFRTVPDRTPPAGRALPKRLPASRGSVRYVARRGSDRNPGTRGRPWRTIQHALDTLLPGQTALVRAGTYAQSLVMHRAGTAKAPITVRAYPGERPVVHPGGSESMDYPLRITA